MSMHVTVKGEDINPTECLGYGWTTAISKRKSQSQPGVSDRASSTQRGSGRGGSRTPATGVVKKRLAAASRLPHLPREHFRIIVHPRGGMDVRRISQIKVTQALAMAAQLAPAETGEDIVCANVVLNIFVVSTPTEKNARAYARVEALLVGTTRYEVNSYLGAPDNTCKGIVRGVDLDFDHSQLRDMIVQPRNPKALEVKRIKDITTIIVLFDGLKVPNYVMCGASMLRCTLYRRQTDVCYACGRLGHRAECARPRRTRFAGDAEPRLPRKSTSVRPSAPSVGGPHLTADKTCKQRFQVPYVVRRRRRQRKRATETPATPVASSLRSTCQGHDPSVSRAPSRGRSATPAGRRSRSRGRSRSSGRSCSTRRSRSGIRTKETPWADRVKQKPPKVTKGSPPEHSNPRIEQLEQENAQLRAALEQLRAQFESFRKSHSSTPAPSELAAEASAPIWSAKKRALVAPVEGERDLEEFKSEITNSMKDVRESVNSLQGAVMTLVQTVTALTNRVDTLETRVGLGDSNSGFSGAVRSGLPSEAEGFRRGSPYERPSKSSKHGGSG
ncbi:hypothetical protein MTO96_017053 [Rhipicephalus appendiculatus]